MSSLIFHQNQGNDFGFGRGGWDVGDFVLLGELVTRFLLGVSELVFVLAFFLHL